MLQLNWVSSTDIYISTVELIQISRYSLIYLKLKVAETPVAWKENIIPLAMN